MDKDEGIDFHAVPIINIIIRKDRQRREVGDVSELRQSIERFGLFHPIIVTRENVLVAGECRLTACKQLKWAAIPVHYTDELNPLELDVIQYEENARRSNLTWQEETVAVFRYHEANTAINPDWKVKDTAESLRNRSSEVSKMIMVAKYVLENNPKIKHCAGYSPAYNVILRDLNRATDNELAKLEADLSGIDLKLKVKPHGGEQTKETQDENEGQEREDGQENSSGDQEGASLESPSSGIHLLDFCIWAEDYSGPKFNFLHCDFPYGIDHGKSERSYGAGWGAYNDTEEVYFKLMFALLRNKDKILAPSAHIMFWFSMHHYHTTVELFKDHDFKVQSHPLIWHKTGRGICPDPHRGPWRYYETALIMSQGDRKVVKSVNNIVLANLGNKEHMSEKDPKMLKHFLGMFVDKYSHVLDPTCGSGNALAIAKELGAERILGLDIDQNSVNVANRRFKYGIS